MEVLFQTKTKYTFEEYQKFNNAVTMNINKMATKIVGVEVCFFLLAYIYMTKNLYATMILVLCGLIFPLLFYFTMKDNIKRTYQSNKSMKDLEVTFEFYEDNVRYFHKLGDNKVEYKDLYGIIETKSNFYLMIAKNQGLIIKKDNCSEELKQFIINLKTKK